MAQKKCDSLPGSYGNLLLGEGLEVYEKEHCFYTERYRRYGCNYKTRILGDKIAVLSDPAFYKEILIDKQSCFSSEIGWYVLEPYFGKGILLEDSELHQIYRNLFSKAFHKKAITEYLTIINKYSVKALDFCMQGNTNLFLVGRNFTLPIISEMIFGPKSDEFIYKVKLNFEKILSGLRDIFKFPFPNNFTDHGKALLARDELQNIIDIEIDRCISTSDFDSSHLISAFSFQVYTQNLTRKKILELILSLFFGGHDTTANIIFSSLILLDNHESEKNKLVQEVLSIDGGINEVLSSNYLDAIIKECIRLFPPVPYIPRGVIKDVEVSGILLSKGWHVHLCPLITHRNPKHFYSPNRFKPERFLDNSKEIKPYTYVPFGLGKHGCIGSELAIIQLKIFLFNLCQKYQWKVTPSYDSTEVFSPFKLSPYFELILSD